MRRLVVDGRLAPGALREELGRTGVVELELLGAPAMPREELLAAAASSEALLLARFDGPLSTPLAELALLAHAAVHPDGAVLDLTGALLAPLLARVGRDRAWALLAAGPRVRAADVLPRFARGGRSPTILRLIEGLLASTAASPRGLLAVERAAFQLVMTLPDRVEGIRAFRERRPSAFDW